MNRRQFLTRALIAVPVIAAPAALLEALMPRKSIFLPPSGGWLVAEESNTIYLVNEKYFIGPGRGGIVDLLQKRMNQVMNRSVDEIARIAFAPNPVPVMRVGGIDVYFDAHMHPDEWEFRQS